MTKIDQVNDNVLIEAVIRAFDNQANPDEGITPGALAKQLKNQMGFEIDPDDMMHRLSEMKAAFIARAQISAGDPFTPVNPKYYKSELKKAIYLKSRRDQIVIERETNPVQLEEIITSGQYEHPFVRVGADTTNLIEGAISKIVTHYRHLTTTLHLRSKFREMVLYLIVRAAEEMGAGSAKGALFTTNIGLGGRHRSDDEREGFNASMKEIYLRQADLGMRPDPEPTKTELQEWTQFRPKLNYWNMLANVSPALLDVVSHWVHIGKYLLDEEVMTQGALHYYNLNAPIMDGSYPTLAIMAMYQPHDDLGSEKSNVDIMRAIRGKPQNPLPGSFDMFYAMAKDTGIFLIAKFPKLAGEHVTNSLRRIGGYETLKGVKDRFY